MILKLQRASESSGSLVKSRLLCWTPRVSDSLVGGGTQEFDLLSKLLGEADTENHRCREKSLDLGIRSPVSLFKS